jgi:hypothetical protein
VSFRLLIEKPGGDILLDPLDPEEAVRPPGEAGGASGRVLVLYGRLLGFLLGGYLILDKAFAYIHLPGTPAYVGELVLLVGGVGVLSATGYLRIPIRDEPVLALLVVFFLWALVRFPPGLRTYGINAVRDFALIYYSFFAFFTIAALAKAPDLLDRWLAQLSRFIPWLLLWLPFGLIIATKVRGPSVPFSGGVSVLTHKPGNAAIAALIALGYMWLFPETRSARSRGLWSCLALVTMAVSATQNRGGLVGASAGAIVGLAFVPTATRLRLIAKATAVVVIGLALAVQFSLSIPNSANNGRSFTASQLIQNVLSIKGVGSGAAATGTVAARDLLWSLVLKQQIADDRLVDGYGFGVNLPLLVNDTQVTSGADPLRSPHNSHDDVLARLGLIGLGLWIALWVGWYTQMIVGCGRLARRGMRHRRRVAVLCMMAVTAILVSSFFDPQLEGAQIAALLWSAFGIGVAVTSFRGWFAPQPQDPS